MIVIQGAISPSSHTPLALYLSRLFSSRLLSSSPLSAPSLVYPHLTLLPLGAPLPFIASSPSSCLLISPSPLLYCYLPLSPDDLLPNCSINKNLTGALSSFPPFHCPLHDRFFCLLVLPPRPSVIQILDRCRVLLLPFFRRFIFLVCVFLFFFY